MADRRGRCLVTVYASVPPAIEEEYNRWYNTHQIPELLKVPGVLAAVRYQAYAGEPKYLTVYELANEEVLENPKLLTGTPSDWDRRMQPQIQVVELGIYDRIFEYKQPPEHHATRAITVRFSPPAEAEAEFNEWYNTEHVPGLISVPGMHCGRRYKKRWGAGAANYLALYEFDDEAIQSTDAWRKAGTTEWSLRMLPKIGPPKIARHRRIFEARTT